MISIGIVGCGTIGSAIARAIQDGRIRARLAGFASRTPVRAEAVARSLTCSPPVLGFHELIGASDLVAEAASIAAVAEIVPPCLEARKDVFVISVAGLLGHDDWFRRAEAQGARIVVPSGAIAGLDGVRAASVGRVDSVLLITRRPPEALRGAPYVVERGLELNGLTRETVIFDGTAREACRGFPKHVNVPAALSLAGVGLDRTRVQVLAVPGCRFNQHQIEIQGEFGRLRVEIENTPSSMNPRTGLLSVFSSIETLAEYARSRR